MNKILKNILHVYKIFSVCLISILIIAALIVWLNIGRVTVFAIGKALDRYNTEITELISDFFVTSGESMGFRAIQMTEQDGIPALRFEFTFDSSDLASVNINSFHNMSSIEIASELGITPDEIPTEIKSLVQSTRLAVDIYIYDENDNVAFNRLIKPEEIADFLNTN